MLYRNPILLLLTCGVLLVTTTEGSDVEGELRNRQLAAKAKSSKPPKTTKPPKSSKNSKNPKAPKEGKAGKSCKAPKLEKAGKGNPFNPLTSEIVDSLVSFSIEIGSDDYDQFNGCSEYQPDLGNANLFLDVIETFEEIDLSDGTGTLKACVDDVSGDLQGRLYLCGYDLVFEPGISELGIFYALPPGSLEDLSIPNGWYEIDEDNTITFTFDPTTIEPITVGESAYLQIGTCDPSVIVSGLEDFLDLIDVITLVQFDTGGLQVCTDERVDGFFGRLHLVNEGYDVILYGTEFLIVPAGTRKLRYEAGLFSFPGENFQIEFTFYRTLL